MAHRWKVLTVVSVAVFMASLDVFIVNIAFADIGADFNGTSVASLSWVLNAYAIVFAALLVPAGRLADRVGRKRAFLGGLGLFLLGSVLCGAAPSVEALVAARVVQAGGGALLLPTSLALLLPEFAPRERAAAIGIWAAVGGIAAAAGPPLGGVLVEVSWRLVFLVNLPVGAVAAWYAVRLLRESHDEARAQKVDLPGSVLLALAVGGLTLGLVEAPGWGWGDPRTLGVLLTSAVLAAAFWTRCRTHPDPVVDPALLRVRSYAMANVTMVLFSAAFAAMLLGNVLFLQEVWGESVLRSGLSVTPGPLMAAAFAVGSGRLAHGLGQRWLAGLGCALFALGSAWWLWRVGPTPRYAADLLPGMLLTGSGVGLVLPSMSSAAAASLPPARFATGSAVLTMSRQIGTVLGVAIIVAILDTPSAADPVAAYQGGWRFMVIASALGAIAGLAIGPVAQHRPAAAAAPVPPTGARAGGAEIAAEISAAV
jgi:EmrB/QacA subfamily drug resistance transporter